MMAADTSRAIILQTNDLINKKPGFESGRQQQLMRLPKMKISFERLGRCGSYKLISKWCWKSSANVVLGVLPCVLGFHGGSHPHGIAFEFLFDPKRSEGMLSCAGEDNRDLPLPSNGQTLPD